MSSKRNRKKLTKKVKALEVNEVAMPCRYCPYGNEEGLTLPEAVANGVLEKLGRPIPEPSPKWWCEAKCCIVDPDKPRFCSTRSALMKKSHFKIVDLTK